MCSLTEFAHGPKPCPGPNHELIRPKYIHDENDELRGCAGEVAEVRGGDVTEEEEDGNHASGEVWRSILK